MKILYVAYTNLHLKLANTLKIFLDVKIIGPNHLNCDLFFSEKEFDFRTFYKIFLYFKKNDLFKIYENIDIIGVSCINFTLNNLIYSNFSSKNIFITYDGLMNLQTVPLTKKEKIKDIIKYLFFNLKGLKYTIRKKTLSGYDIINLNSHFPGFSNNLLSIYYFINKERIISPRIDAVLYISIANNYLNVNKYKTLESEALKIIDRKFKKKVLILYKENIDDNFLNKQIMIDRKLFHNLCAEEILQHFNVEIICGDVSSLLFNAKILNPQKNIYSIALDKYCNIFEKNMYYAYEKSLIELGIEVIN